MAHTYDRVFRERALAVYASSKEGVHPVSKMLGVGYRTLQRWVAQHRDTGSVAPRPRGGGWKSGIDEMLLTALVHEVPDSTVAEFCAEYNRRVPRADRTSVSAVQRALKRWGFVCKKKRPRPSETGRPDVVAPRDAFVAWMKTIDPTRLVFLDESGANLAMGRSHVWVRRGEEYVEPRPMNWGTNRSDADRRRAVGRLGHVGHEVEEPARR